MLIYKRRTCAYSFPIHVFAAIRTNIINANTFSTTKYKLRKQLLIEGVVIISHSHCAQNEMKLHRTINDLTPCRFNFFSA